MRRLAMLSLHTSPLAQPGTGDGGGMNVYVRELAAALARSGAECDVFTRAWRQGLPPLVEVEPGPVLTQARLRVPARIWQLLLGIDAPEEHLTRVASPSPEAGASASPSQDDLARTAAAAWRPTVMLQLCGRRRASLDAVATRCAEHLGLEPIRIAVEALPASSDDLDRLVRLLRLEGVLRPLAVIVDAFGLKTRVTPLHAFLHLRTGAPIIPWVTLPRPD